MKRYVYAILLLVLTTFVPGLAMAIMATTDPFGFEGYLTKLDGTPKLGAYKIRIRLVDSSTTCYFNFDGGDDRVFDVDTSNTTDGFFAIEFQAKTLWFSDQSKSCHTLFDDSPTSTSNRVTGLQMAVSADGGTNWDELAGTIQFESAAHSMTSRLADSAKELIGFPLLVTSPVTDQILKFNGSRWVNGALDIDTVLGSSPLPLASGGTGATTQADAATAILPTQPLNAGKFLTTNGSSVSWANPPAPVNFTGSLSGDVTGAQGSTTVTKIQGVTVPSPTSGDEGKVLTYHHAGPAYQWLAPSIDYSNITNKPNLGSLATASQVDLATQVTGTLSVSKGGTGLSTITNGSLIYASATDTLSSLSVGSNGQYLKVSSGVPTWSNFPTAFSAGSGTAAAPAYSFSSNTGLFNPAGYQIGFSTAGTEKMRITDGGTIGVGTSAPSAAAILDLTSSSKGFLMPRLTTAERDTIASPPAGLQIYNKDTSFIEYYNGSLWESLSGAGGGGGITSLNGLTDASQSLAVDSTGTSLSYSSSAGTHTLHIPMVSTVGAAAGLISDTDYNNFNGKLSDVNDTAPLAPGKVWVGDVNEKAKEQWFGIDDLRTEGGVQQFSTNCITADYTLTWSAVSDSFICTPISISSSQVSGLVPSATTDTTNATNITSGTLALAYGGTGATDQESAANAILPAQSAATANRFLKSDGSKVLWEVLPTELPAADGTASDPGYAFSSSTTTGFFSPSSNEIGFSIAGTEKMRITAAGNIGVGTSTPSFKLEVAGPIASRPLDTLAGSGGRILLKELDTYGNHFVGFKAPDSIPNDVAWELPAADGEGGQVLTTNGSGLLSWSWPKVQSLTTISRGSPTSPENNGRVIYNSDSQHLEYSEGFQWRTIATENPSDIKIVSMNSDLEIDWSKGSNIKYITQACPQGIYSTIFSNIKDGVHYTFIVQDNPAINISCLFNFPFSTIHLLSSGNSFANSVSIPQSSGKQLLLKFFKAGTHIYVDDQEIQ